MKLIYAKGACSLAVHVMLEEMGKKFEGICVGLDDKTVLNKYNSQGYVPAIVLDSGEVLTEAVAILEYLAEMPSGSKFFPRDSVLKTRCRECLIFTSTEIHQKLGPLFHRGDLSKKFETEVVTIVEKRLSHMDAHLGRSKFLVGDQYTIADMYAVAILRIAEHVKIKLDKFKNVSRYKNMLENLPTIRRVIDIENRTQIAAAIKAA